MIDNVPVIEGDTPMADTEFHIWLVKNINVSDIFTDALKLYLEEFGFEMGKDKIDGYQLALHRAIFKHTWWMYFNVFRDTPRSDMQIRLQEESDRLKGKTLGEQHEVDREAARNYAEKGNQR